MMLKSIEKRLFRAYTLSIPPGDRAMLLSPTGSVSYVDGPRFLVPFPNRVCLLNRYTAKIGEYLVITLRSGETEILPGPVEVYENPTEQVSVEIKKGLELRASEAIVVYVPIPTGTQREIVYGPKTYIPKSTSEFVHEFSWHGKKGPFKVDSEKVPNALKFFKLRTTPDQLYMDVHNVRTTDDALLTVSLMIFFELQDIHRMLDQTHDPIANFINAGQSDVIRFASSVTFEKFKAISSGLNDLKSFPSLVETAERIGYRITSVVNRGYTSAARLQQMHDQAIESRTSLVLEKETEIQKQEITQFKLNQERSRAEMELDLERRRELHKLEIKAAEEEQGLRLKAAKLKAESEHIKHLTDLGIDMTQVLVAAERKVDNLIQIESKIPGLFNSKL